jgi:hypothetical protein
MFAVYPLPITKLITGYRRDTHTQRDRECENYKVIEGFRRDLLGAGAGGGESQCACDIGFINIYIYT